MQMSVDRRLAALEVRIVVVLIELDRHGRRFDDR
jgi:hypothetical protein